MAAEPSAVPDVANWILSIGVVIGTAVGAAIAYLKRPAPKAETPEAALAANALAADRKMIEELIGSLKSVAVELDRINSHLRDAARQVHDEAIIEHFVETALTRHKG